MAEYRALRERYSLLEICRAARARGRRHAAAGRRDRRRRRDPLLRPAAALHADGARLRLRQGRRARRSSDPIRSAADVDRLRDVRAARSARRTCSRRSGCCGASSTDRVPLIGFGGAPFTLAAYAIEGGPSTDYARTKAFMYAQPDGVAPALRSLRRVDGRLPARRRSRPARRRCRSSTRGPARSARADYREFALPHTARIFDDARAASGVPLIHFGVGTDRDPAATWRRPAATSSASTGALPLDEAWDVIGHDRAHPGQPRSRRCCSVRAIGCSPRPTTSCARAAGRPGPHLQSRPRRPAGDAARARAGARAPRARSSSSGAQPRLPRSCGLLSLAIAMRPELAVTSSSSAAASPASPPPTSSTRAASPFALLEASPRARRPDPHRARRRLHHRSRARLGARAEAGGARALRGARARAAAHPVHAAAHARSCCAAAAASASVAVGARHSADVARRSRATTCSAARARAPGARAADPARGAAGDDESVAIVLPRGGSAPPRCRSSPQPLLGGIHAGRHRRALDAARCFRGFVDAERAHGSVLRASGAHARRRRPTAPFRSLRGGHGRAGRRRSSGGCRPAASGSRPAPSTLIARRRRLARRHAQGGRRRRARDPRRAGVRRGARCSRRSTSEAAALCAAVPYVSTASVALAWPRDGDRASAAGTGFVVRAAAVTARLRITACTWVSSKWAGRAPAGHGAAARVHRRRARSRRRSTLPTTSWSRVASRRSGARARHRRRRRCWRASTAGRDAGAQHIVGHLARVARIERAPRAPRRAVRRRQRLPRRRHSRLHRRRPSGRGRGGDVRAPASRRSTCEAQACQDAGELLGDQIAAVRSPDRTADEVDVSTRSSMLTTDGWWRRSRC